jgi:predicted Zn-dependent protease
VRANPDDAIARADLGFIYAGQSQRKEALKQLAAAKALASDDPAVLLRVGETYELLGDHAKGFAYLRQAVNRGYRIADLAVDYDARAIMANPRLRKELEAAQPRPSQP